MSEYQPADEREQQVRRNIRDVMTMLGMTQRQLAAAIGMPEGMMTKTLSLSQWSRSMKVTELLSIAAALETSPGRLLWQPGDNF
jgi:transcriptional regulator with XRE-family HTH domain